MERSTVAILGVGGLLIWGLVAKPVTAPAAAAPPASTTPPGGLPASGGSTSPPADPGAAKPITPITHLAPPVVIANPPVVTPPPATSNAMPAYTPNQLLWLETPIYNGTIMTKGAVVFNGQGPVPAGVPSDALWWVEIPGEIPQYSYTWPVIPAGIN